MRRGQRGGLEERGEREGGDTEREGRRRSMTKRKWRESQRKRECDAERGGERE